MRAKLPSRQSQQAIEREKKPEVASLRFQRKKKYIKLVAQTQRRWRIYRFNVYNFDESFSYTSFTNLVFILY